MGSVQTDQKGARKKRYGSWRPDLREVIIRYLECGDLHNGFARIRCNHCETERLLSTRAISPAMILLPALPNIRPADSYPTSILPESSEMGTV